jgi:hypothetical protein
MLCRRRPENPFAGKVPDLRSTAAAGISINHHLNVKSAANMAGSALKLVKPHR